jgi:hypothetical protein
MLGEDQEKLRHNKNRENKDACPCLIHPFILEKYTYIKAADAPT